MRFVGHIRRTVKEVELGLVSEAILGFLINPASRPKRFYFLLSFQRVVLFAKLSYSPGGQLEASTTVVFVESKISNLSAMDNIVILKTIGCQTLLRQPLTHLQPDCWMCQGIYEPRNLVFYESRVSVAKLNPDQAFEGYTFLTLKWHETELYNLFDKDRKQFLEDMSKVAKGLARAFNPDKMNYELLGNSMPHLHWHLVPRYVSDPMWGRPIWAGSKRRRRLNQEGYELLKKKLAEQLGQPRRKRLAA